MGKKLVLREKLTEIKPFLGTKEIIVIIGARRVGKTTLLGQIKDLLIRERKISRDLIYSFNLDLIDDLMTIGDQSDFIRFLKSRIRKGRKSYVFIDEVQRLENPGLFLKGIYDLGLPVKFIVSGSSTLEIKSKVQESLTGRKRLFYLSPFTFEEFLSARDPQLLKLKSHQGYSRLSQADRRRLRQLLYEFMVWGGYPEVCLTERLAEKVKALEEIYNSYLERDIVAFLKIEDRLTFTKLVKVLSAQIGNLVNVNELASTLGVKNETIKRYLEALEATFIIKLLTPYFRNVRKEISKMPKIYFMDSGLRNFSLRKLDAYQERVDQGEILENYVFSLLTKELKTYENLYFWRTKDKAEVDFIVDRQVLLPIEVKAVELKKPVYPKALLGFSKDYQIKKALITNLSLEVEVAKSGLAIKYLVPESLPDVL